ncbi:MAG: 50S ribosomal protein L5 [Candidatus Nanohalarchaeota archaeon]|nr:MAG: 50S ribosomal protein L5 [Candidatus Nanohaloarchaeota archaeon]
MEQKLKEKPKKQDTKAKKDKSLNPMRQIKIEKVVFSMGLKESGEVIERVYKLAQKLTGAKPTRTQSTRSARTFRMRRGLDIGVKVTLRREKAEQFLIKSLKGIENNLKKTCFDNNGNVSFGIKEHLDIPGEQFDPTIGIFGFNVNTTLSRGGHRIRRRSLKTQKLPKSIKINQNESIDFFKKNFNVNII